MSTVGGWNRPTGEVVGRVDEGLVAEMTGFARDRFQWQAVPLFVLRIAAIGAAAAAVTWSVVATPGVIAAVVAAMVAATVGHALALTRTRLPILLGSAAAVALVGGLIGHLSVSSEAFVEMLGPSLAIRVSTIARFGGYAAGLAGVLRIAAVRVPSLVGAELIAIAAAVVVPLAPHREGVVARPLWLSDWAWHNGYDPADVLLAIGGALALLLGGLLMARPGNRVSLISWLSLAGLLLLAVSLLNVDGLPQPKAGNDLGLTGDEKGDPPLPTPPGPWDGPGRSNKGGKGGGQGGGQPKDANGGQGGQDGGQPQPGDGGGQDGGQSPQQGGQDGGQSQQQGGQDGGQSQQQGGQDGGQSQQQQGQGGGQSQQQQGQGGGGGKPPPREPNLDEQQGSSGTPAPMAVVLFGDDYMPPAGGFYFRQDVWSHFNGSRMVSSRRPDVDRDVLKTFPGTERTVAEPPPEDGRQAVTAKVYLTVKHTRPFALESLVTMAPTKNPDAQRFVRAFRFDSRAQSVDYTELLHKVSGAADWSEDVREYYTITPDDDRYAALADKIVADLPEPLRDDPFAQALAIKLWLDDNITYSTSERHAGAVDPAADFLFGNQIGYCVHIAHAAAYLWRSRGIAARVGTGYRAELDNLKGSALVIRSSDAHAWPELYLEGLGWVVLDIAPKQTLDKPGEAGDDELTENLAEIARSAGDDEAKPEADGPRKSTERGLGLPWQLLIALGVVAFVLYTIKIWRRLAPLWATGRHVPRVAYRCAIDRLGEVGLVRNYGETRTSFAARVMATVPAQSGVAALSEAARLGAPTADRKSRPEYSRAQWKQALAAQKADLAANVSLKRRILGLLNPTVIWQVR